MSEMARNAFKWSTTVGHIFEIYIFEMVRNTYLFIIVGENFEIYMSEMARNVFKLSTMVGEKIEI